MTYFRRRSTTVHAEQFWPSRRPWPSGVLVSTESVTGYALAPSVVIEADGKTAVSLGEPVVPGDMIITERTGRRYPYSWARFNVDFEPTEGSNPDDDS